MLRGGAGAARVAWPGRRWFHALVLLALRCLFSVLPADAGLGGVGGEGEGDAACARDSDKKESVLGLPAVGESDGKLEVGGKLSLQDQMGPLVINEDGSMRRIADWSEKTEREREAILRVLGRRNKARLDRLKKLKNDLVENAKRMGFIPNILEEHTIAETMIDLQLVYNDTRIRLDCSTKLPSLALTSSPRIMWPAPAPGSDQQEMPMLFSFFMFELAHKHEGNVSRSLLWVIGNRRANCGANECSVSREALLENEEILPYAAPDPAHQVRYAHRRYVLVVFKHFQNFLPNTVARQDISNERSESFNLAEASESYELGKIVGIAGFEAG